LMMAVICFIAVPSGVVKIQALNLLVIG